MVVAGKLIKDNSEEVKEQLIRLLQQQGFQVDAQTPQGKGKMEDFQAKYDACIVALHVTGFAQYNSMRVKWASPADQPWYVSQIPTIFLSLGFPNHLIDVPMARTYINAYLDSETVMEAAIGKIMGKSEFKGRYQENVFCGRWDTRL